MTWNYRVMRHEYQGGLTGEREALYALHEVYYESAEVDDLAVTAAEVGYSAAPVTVSAESVEELRNMLRLMLSALEKPVLLYPDTEIGQAD